VVLDHPSQKSVTEILIIFVSLFDVSLQGKCLVVWIFLDENMQDAFLSGLVSTAMDWQITSEINGKVS